MRRETELFVEAIVREDRSILDFLDGRYTFLNERLARHYGIAGVTGPAFRRVDLAGTPRGGVLTQASVLTVSSYATRTSPVLRGKWILDNLLNAPPPEPPPDVPNLDEAKIGTAASLRQQLEEHRTNPICASCHQRMDPLGFGLENFDAVGAWRTMDGKFPIDASGTLPDGRDVHRARRAAGDPDGRARRLRARHHLEAADLRARPRPRALRQPHGQADRQPSAERRLPLLGSRPRDRQEPAVPDAPAASPSPSPTSSATLDAPARDRASRRSRDASNEERRVMIITRKHLHRRTFLKGIGAAIALPMLDAMTPALAAAGQGREGAAAAGLHLRAERRRHGRLDAGGRRPRLRVLAHPEAARAVPRATRSCSPASRTSNGNALGDGPGDHARAGASYLTGVHPQEDRRAPTSRTASRSTRSPRSSSAGRRASPRSSSAARTRARSATATPATRCAYTNSLSWRGPTTPMPPETNPRPGLRAALRRRRHQPRPRSPCARGC